MRRRKTKVQRFVTTTFVVTLSAEQVL